MSIRITCPSCRESYAIDTSLQGKRIRCRGCNVLMNIPAAPRRRDDDEDEDEGRPDRRVTTRRARDDDEPPRRAAAARRPRDDDDEAPRHPARARDDEDDDRPRRKKAVASGPPLGLLIGGGAGVLLLVGLVIGGIFLLRGSGDKPAQAGPTDPTRGRPDLKGAGDAPGAMSAAKLADVKEATLYLRVELPGGAIAQGTGFCAGQPGIVVTNAHVLGMLHPVALPPRKVTAFANSGQPGERSFTSQVVAVDRDNDLAMLRLDGREEQFPTPLKLGSAAALTETQKVYIFGFPLGEQLGRNITVSESSVSSLRREGGAVKRVQVNGGMQPGNSGGPVTDSLGQVVGVSVAIIQGTQLNFAVPAELVREAFDGSPGDVDLGAPYTEGGKTFIPARLAVLNPLGRAKSVKLEVFAGARGAHDPTRGPRHTAVAMSGDGPRQVVTATSRDGAYTAEAPVPALKDGQVVYAQVVVVNADGVSRYGPVRATEVMPGSTLHRTAVDLRFKAPTGRATRTLRMRSTASMVLARGKERVMWSQKMDGYVLEELTRDARGKGTGVRLTLALPKFTREGAGGTIEAPEELRHYLARYTPSFLIDARNEAKERARHSFDGVPEVARAAVQSLYETVCNNWEMTTLPLPNRRVQPRESWPAQVPMMVRGDDKLQTQLLHVTVTYEGLRQTGVRREAYLRLSGVVKAPVRGEEALGQVKGHALVDVDKGMLSQVSVTISTEVETGSSDVRLQASEECTVDREEGNTQGIKPGPVKG